MGGGSAPEVDDRKVERVTTDGAVVSGERVAARLAEVGVEPRWTDVVPGGLTGVVADSRRVEEGDLFCAVEGLTVDGHDYVDQARERGAAAAVVEREVLPREMPQLVVTDSRLALAHLASLFHGDPSRSMGLTGVTGTDGKTTTAWILRHLLAGDSPTAAMGTLGVVGPDGARTAGRLTTPGPVETCRQLEELSERGVRRVVLEVSSHALDQRRVDGLEFENVVFTNLTREHLDYHRDMDSYRRAKLRVLDLLRPGGGCVLNADDPEWADVAAGRGERITYGCSSAADVRARDVRLDAAGSRWRLSTGREEAAVRLPLPGGFNVRNALAAAAVALRTGMELAAIAERLAATPPVPGRMEVLRRRPCTVVRDYAHTPDALRRVLEELRPDGGRVIVVFGCGGDRDRGKRPLMGRAAGEAADLALVTTDNPRSEDPAEIAREVLEGLGEAEHEVVLDRREAIARALEVAGMDDVVLLAGKGHEDYQLFGDEKVPFDEARVVAELTREEDAP